MINALYSYFTILSDTQEIILRVGNEREKEKLKVKDINKISDIVNPPKAQKYFTQQNNLKQSSSNAQKLMRDDFEIGETNLDNEQKEKYKKGY